MADAPLALPITCQTRTFMRFIAIVCLLPEALIGFYNAPFYMGGTSVLIVVSVTMDTVTQIQSHLLAHQYEGLIKRSKLRGKGVR